MHDPVAAGCNYAYKQGGVCDSLITVSYRFCPAFERMNNYRQVQMPGQHRGCGYRLIVALALHLLLTAAATTAIAGGGPENVFLLVNANSESSKTIANHYIALRKIPANNVMYVDWKWSVEFGSGKLFREKLLLPMLEEMAKRQVGPQIDYLIYSSDFPWRLELGDLFPDINFQSPFLPRASLTGSTFYGALLASSPPIPAVTFPQMNWYVPQIDMRNLSSCQALGDVPSRGFRFRYFWESNGTRSNDAQRGQRYFLSTMLGVTSGRGNTVPEVLSYLQRAAGADGKRPKGTIYFMKNGDIRSGVRHNCYESVAEQINRLGVQARVMQGVVPPGALDIAGLMTGAQDFNIASSGAKIVPGAICEHLTSAGGILDKKGGYQTPLTEFLKYGAAGASGTVIEPHAIQAKFPLPTLQLHYVRGCSLAESFYQSIMGPYQILIVGDPLCQPWAMPPQITVVGVSAGDEVKGTIEIAPLATAAAGHRVGQFELYVDGRLVAQKIEPGKPVSVDTTKLADGYHELRVVGVHEDPIETQGRAIVPVAVNNHDAKLEFTLTPPDTVASSGKIRVSVRQAGAAAIVIQQNSRQVGRVEGEAGDVELEAALLGRGPTALQAQSEGSVPAVSMPLSITVQ
jgi:uncharacterized protein (TIGR03790 family)